LIIKELQKQFDVSIAKTKAYVFSSKFFEFFSDVVNELEPSASYTCSECLVEVD